MGTNNLSHPSLDENTKRLPPGASMHIDNHTSPITFAKEVKISARTLSANNTGMDADAKQQRLTALPMG